MAFQYQARSKAQVTTRVQQSSGSYDSPFDPNFIEFKPKVGDNRIRILPPTWKHAEHYGLDVHVNFSIGPDNQAYLSLKKMRNEPDPIAEELARAQAAGDDPEYISNLKPSKRVMVWLVDRDAENEGPKYWAMSWTIDRDIAKLSIDSATGEILCVDHPEEGYDIEFARTGTGLNTKYIGMQIARRSTPLHRDRAIAEQWLNFIVKHPVDTLLKYYSYEHIKAQLFAAPKEKDKEAESEKKAGPTTRAQSRTTAEDDDGPTPQPRARAAASEEAEAPRARAQITDAQAPLDRPAPTKADEPAPSRARIQVDDDEDSIPAKKEPTPPKKTEAPPAKKATLAPAEEDDGETPRTSLRGRIASALNDAD